MKAIYFLQLYYKLVPSPSRIINQTIVGSLSGDGVRVGSRKSESEVDLELESHGVGNQELKSGVGLVNRRYEGM